VLLRENSVRGSSSECLEAALRVLVFQSEQHSKSDVERTTIELPQQRLPPRLRLRLQPA